MKKFLAATAAAALILSMTACGCSASSDMGSVSGSVSTPSVSESPSVGNNSSTMNSGNTHYKIGLGFVSSTSGSSAADTDYNGSANFELTACALCVDDSGKIIDVRFDTVEAGVGFDATGAFTGNIDDEILTKREMGDDYGLGAVSGIGKNWYEQVDALENWMRGKNINEAMGMRLSYDGDKQIPDEEDLRTSVTISVTEHLEALEKAYADATRSGYSGIGSSSDNALSDSLGESSSDDYVNESSSR